MNISGIILAAGEGKRASGNKLSRYVMGKPMLQWVIEMAVNSNIKHNIIITGKEKEFAEKLAVLYNIETVHNTDYRSGMSSSIKRGVESLPNNTDGFAIILGDMPFVKPETMNSLIAEFSKSRIIVPVFQGKRGHPVIFPIDYKAAIFSIKGDIGAKEVLINNKAAIKYFETEDRGVIQDINYFKPEKEWR
ncbi:MAG: nucleotidyltransferase family protein [Bacillota bacterium]|nr:nucleotidyltransferase family protein [Bacillota bacterium]